MDEKVKAPQSGEMFRTQRAYIGAGDGLSGSMEDYLEMIYRISSGGDAVRVRDLSRMLNVSPSSASKMTNVLKGRGLVNFEKYGYITLTESGRTAGEYLFYRHDLVNRFLCLLNGTDDELIQTEKIEHYLSERTVAGMEDFLKKAELSDT